MAWSRRVDTFGIERTKERRIKKIKRVDTLGTHIHVSGKYRENRFRAIVNSIPLLLFVFSFVLFSFFVRSFSLSG